MVLEPLQLQGLENRNLKGKWTKKGKKKKGGLHMWHCLYDFFASLLTSIVFLSLFFHIIESFFLFLFFIIESFDLPKKNLGHTNSHAYLSLICNLFTFQVEYLSSYIIFPFFFLYFDSIFSCHIYKQCSWSS